MSFLMDFWLSGVPPSPNFELILESQAAEKGEKFPFPVEPTFQPLLAPALLVQLGPSYPLGCRS